MMSKNNTVVIHNVKNPEHRRVHANGAQGGVTPSGHINLSFYSQREAILKDAEVTTDDERKTVKSPKGIKESEKEIVRKFEVDIYMDVEACENLKDFLEKQIEELKGISERKKQLTPASPELKKAMFRASSRGISKALK